MKNFCALFLALFALVAQAAVDIEELTGDTKLSCEAILCLSSGERPSECEPSLRHFFGIHKDTTAKTIKARTEFLSLCPIVSEDDNVKKRVKQIAKGAGRCDAAYLNSTLRESVEVKECNIVRIEGKRFVSRWVPADQNAYCSPVRTRQVIVINNNKPSYCADYENHEWSHNLGARYVGEKLSGGHWEDVQ
jgi:hypothetical protein